uniref:hypothetical protein n=1 Tax=Jeotgalibaca porci TaxID=1868793 RepID=UPI00359F41F8
MAKSEFEITNGMMINSLLEYFIELNPEDVDKLNVVRDGDELIIKVKTKENPDVSDKRLGFYTGMKIKVAR